MVLSINPKGTVIGKAVGLNKIYSNFLIKFAFFIVWVAGLFSIGLIAGRMLSLVEVPEPILGMAYILIALFLFYIANRAFYFDKIKYPHPLSLSEAREKITSKSPLNIFSIFSFELAKATSSIFAKNKILTKDLALSLLASSDMNFILARLGIGKEVLLSALSDYPGENSVEKIILQSLDLAIAEGHHQIEVGDVFVALCETDVFFKKMLSNLKLETVDIANVVYWQTKIVREYKISKKMLDPYRLKLTGGIGRDWIYGYAPYLKQFSEDLTQEIKERGIDVEIIGHDKEIDQIKEALLRQKGGSAVIVGDAGVGKKTTMLGFAKKVLEGQTKSTLDYKHVVSLRVEEILSGAQNQSEVADRLIGILNEAAFAGNLIIFIENIQNFFSEGEVGKVNATQVILPFLDSAYIHIIGTCDVATYNQYIFDNSALSQRFARISIAEPDKNEMIRILEDTVPQIEYASKSIISYEAIKEAIHAADKYIQNIPNPEKSINLLDSATARAVSDRGATIILPKDIMDYVSEKYDIPSSEVGEGEKQKLLDLENIMHKNIIGQNEAIKAIAGSLRRARAGVTDSKKPIGSFLFLGPTGVGKTETAKTLAKAYFDGEDKMIRFDMSEYQNKEDIYRLIGSNMGGELVQGTLTTAVREHPFSLLLFDEIEKANKDILNLFLQILDEGFITDGAGKKVSFSNTIIIATSNAGANLIRQSITNGLDYEKAKKELLTYLQKENIYRPEFLNRFNGVIAFSPLTQGEIMQIANMMIENLKIIVQKNRGINLEISEEVIGILAKQGFDPQMGARPMARVIQEKVEDLIATKILSGELKKDDSYTITTDDIK